MPLYIQLALSPAPKLGEEGELTVTVRINPTDNPEAESFSYGQPKAGLAKAKAWLSFNWINIHGSYSEAMHSQEIPLSEVLVSGDAGWEGDARDKSSIEFKSRIKLPREGVWYINGLFTGEGWSYPTNGHIRVAVADGTAAVMGTPAFKSSPLAYLDNFAYGTGRSVSDYPLEAVLTENRPVIFEMDISKAPRVGEEVFLTCKIYSLSDVPDFSAGITFVRRTKTTLQLEMPGHDLLVDGNLSWKGDLKPGVFEAFSARIKFPEEGDWQILAKGISSEQQRRQEGGYGSYIQFSIANGKSSFGWPTQPDPPGGYKIIPNPFNPPLPSVTISYPPVTSPVSEPVMPVPTISITKIPVTMRPD